MASYLDTRDLADELDELEGREAVEGLGDDETDALDDDERERLAALRELRDAMGAHAWRDGTTLIPESEWEGYAQEFAKDCSNIPDFIARYVDWKSFAEDLASDFTSGEFEGETYYWR